MNKCYKKYLKKFLWTISKIFKRDNNYIFYSDIDKLSKIDTKLRYQTIKSSS